MAALFGFTFGAFGALAVGDAVGAGVVSAANELTEPLRTKAALSAVATNAFFADLNILTFFVWGGVFL
jgi:hypothetical protein